MARLGVRAWLGSREETAGFSLREWNGLVRKRMSLVRKRNGSVEKRDELVKIRNGSVAKRN
jgi:hypothetical protein